MTVAVIAVVFMVAVVLGTVAGCCNGTGSQRKLLISFLQLEGIIDLQAYFPVLWLRKETSFAAPRLPARRKLSCLFCMGMARALFPFRGDHKRFLGFSC